VGPAERHYRLSAPETLPTLSGSGNSGEARANGQRSIPIEKQICRRRPSPRRAGRMSSIFLSAEISCIYKKHGRRRKIHCLVFVPDLASGAKFGLALSRIGNITSDGRPILGLDAKELLRITLDTSPQSHVDPGSRVDASFFSV